MNQPLLSEATAAHPGSEELARLKTAHGMWCHIVGNRPASDEAERQFCDRLKTAVRFAGKSVGDFKQATRLRASLGRGKHLLATALTWDAPSVGQSGSPTSALRGLQWRLMIAWSGLEQMLGSICNQKNPADLEVLLNTLSLPAYQELSPPNGNLHKLRHWREQDDGSDNNGINGFLEVTGKATSRVFRSWLIDGQPIKSWIDALILAKSLRHVTAHGALSASKVKQWGLAPILEQLVPQLATVAAVLFERMNQECQAVYGAGIGTPPVKHERALSLCPPDAEALFRGRKKVEIRRQRTRIIGRIYIYASNVQFPEAEEAALLQQYDIHDLLPHQLVRGRVLGTVELHDCTCEAEQYHWHFRNPEKWKRAKLPKRKPQGTWFTPFQADE